jgi:dGTPase
MPGIAGRYDRFRIGPQDKEDQRTASQRDRDRLLHSWALRRLAGVTQVASAIEGYVYHNRLTHTLKVAQIARRLAERFKQEYSEELLTKFGGVDAETVEAAALAHDLGHPPFGHIGESTLNELVTPYLSDGFEGNAQSLRIVTKLEVRREKVPGLDLTRATLLAMLKYPWERKLVLDPENSVGFLKDKTDLPTIKWGAYASERAELEWAKALSVLPRPETMSLEAAIMDLADDIAYATHDVEDFYRAGLIPLDLLSLGVLIEDNIELVDDGVELERDQFLGQVKKWRDNEDPNQVELAFDRIVDLLPLYEPYRGKRLQQGRIRRIASLLINDYVNSTSINPAALTGARNTLTIGDSDERRIEIKVLKDLTRYYVHNNRALQTQQYGEQRLIRDLFHAYLEESQSIERLSILPPDFPELLDEERTRADAGEVTYATDEAMRARLVADVIARMTDDEAFKMHQRLFGRILGSIVDRLP